MPKQRLDLLMVERGFVVSREKARAMIMAGEVRANGRVVNKPGMQIDSSAEIVLQKKPRYVSRGGDKLEGALNGFKLDVEGRVCADVGASTGGFTDCLLKHGAARIYALDVGYGQLDYRLRQDPRVIAIERTNARYVEKLPEPVSLVVIDASFISLRLLLPPIKGWLTPKADILPLIKPQFEAGRGDVGKGGVVKDRQIHIRVLTEILSFASEQGFSIKGLIPSSIKGPAGNIEFLAWLGWGDNTAVPIEPLVLTAVR